MKSHLLKRIRKRFFGGKPGERPKKVSEAEAKARAEAKAKAEELRRKRTEELVQATGWTPEEAFKAYRSAWTENGIFFREYMNNRLYELQDEEYEEACVRIRVRRALRQFRTDAVARAAGWDKKTAKRAYSSAINELGISFKEYMRYRLYEIPEGELSSRWPEVKLAHDEEAEKRRKERRELTISKIADETGWSSEEVEVKVQDAIDRTSCYPLEYYEFRMFEMTEEQQAEVCLHPLSSAVNGLYNQNRLFMSLTLNKAICNEYFKEFIPRRWCSTLNMKRKNFTRTFESCSRIIYKPIMGHMGYGIETFDLGKQTVDEVFDILQSYPPGVAEEYVRQHSVLSELCPDSVNTIRIVTVVSKRRPVTRDGKYMDVAYAAIRIGAGSSVVDNFHSGGMCASVDVETGEVMTHATDMNCHIFETHPVTGAGIKGLRVPYFREAIELVRKACDMPLVEGQIGWDIAIGEDGPQLIEVNMDPGIVLLSTPYAIDKWPSRPVLEKYLFE